MKAGATADEARRRSAEAVGRIREESRIRVARQRHRACFSWCMVASLAGGLSLAAMDAYEARLRDRAWDDGAAERRIGAINAAADEGSGQRADERPGWMLLEPRPQPAEQFRRKVICGEP